MLFGTIPAMAVGVLAAVRRNSALDYAAPKTKDLLVCLGGAAYDDTPQGPAPGDRGLRAAPQEAKRPKERDGDREDVRPV